MSDFVNKNTGEVFEVEDTNLANICDGDLDFIFKQELQKLTKEMTPSDKGKISISIDVTCFEDNSGLICYKAEAGVKTTYPKVKALDPKVKYLKDDGKVAQRKDRNLFKNGADTDDE